MKDLIIISTTEGDFYYNLMYFLGSIISLGILIYIGVKRKYPLHTWLLLVLGITLFSIIGMYVSTFTLQDWYTLLWSDGLMHPGSKSSLGAFAGMIIAAFIGQKILKTNFPVLDVYAFIIPIILFLQRFGCLMAGCCYGSPVEGNIGFAYAPHFPAYTQHLSSGMIEGNALISLPVHPVPLYFMGASLITLILLMFFRNKFRRKGSKFLFAIACLGFMRFFIEFMRDPVTNHQLAETWLGLKVVQWFILIMVLISIVAIGVLERVKKTNSVFLYTSTPGAYWMLMTILSLGLYLFHPLFERVELTVILSIFTALLIVQIIQAIKVPRASWAYSGPLFIMILACLFMSQTDTLSTEKNNPLDPHLIKKVNSHSFGFALGKILASENNYSGSGCDRVYQGKTDYEVNTTLGYRYDYSSNSSKGKSSLAGFGINITPYATTTYDANGIQTREKNELNFSIGAYFGRDWNKFGYKLGFMGGNMHRYSDRDVEKLDIAPIISLRLGNLNTLYFSGHLGDDINFGFYRYSAKVGIGGAFLKEDKYYRYHVALTERNQVILDTTFPLTRNWVVMPSFIFNDQPTFGLGIQYQLNNN
jgi:phosphatidylglycerol:prolipoprotein diacylglycerol transferase